MRPKMRQSATEEARSRSAETNPVDGTNFAFVVTKWAYSAEERSTSRDFDAIREGAIPARASNEESTTTAGRSTLTWSAWW